MVGEIAKDIERVYGKEPLLVDIAVASIDEPAGRVCDVIFPIVGKDKLTAIIKESQAKGALDGIGAGIKFQHLHLCGRDRK
nr:hypothetical protein [Rhizobium leguminosarum]